MPSIAQITTWPVEGLDALLGESEKEGFHFLRRLNDDWISGANRFSKPGEAFYGVFDSKRLLAVGGINRESADCGRLRRFYVRKEARRKGFGRQLAQHILAFAPRYYSRVVLFTATEAADRFYCSLGFVRVQSDTKVSHELTTPKPAT